MDSDQASVMVVTEGGFKGRSISKDVLFQKAHHFKKRTISKSAVGLKRLTLS